MIGPLLAIGLGCLLGAGVAAGSEPVLQDYFKPGQLEPLAEGTASLYRVPWRSNPRTVPAADALAGLGVYYKHLAPNTNVMPQLAAATLSVSPSASVSLESTPRAAW